MHLFMACTFISVTNIMKMCEMHIMYIEMANPNEFVKYFHSYVQYAPASSLVHGLCIG